MRAQLLVRRGAFDAADRLSREAVEQAARTDWLTDHADALMVRGEVLLAAGRDGAAAAAFRQAVALSTRKGAVVPAERAQAALDAVPGRTTPLTPR